MTSDVSYICKANYLILNISEEVFIATRILTESATLRP